MDQWGELEKKVNMEQAGRQRQGGVGLSRPSAGVRWCGDEHHMLMLEAHVVIGAIRCHCAMSSHNVASQNLL